MEKSTFLLVDDDPTSSLIAEFNIKKVLKAADVKTFKEPGLALAFIQAEREYLQTLDKVYLLTDLNMPGMSGTEFLNRLHEWDPNMGDYLQIYILSACEESPGSDSAISPLVLGNLLKPLKIDAIQELLKS